ncbi:acyl-CoA dehydrogenase family protein [Microbacterium sp. zg.Y1090]|uniref:acyl-CoA dehydrogenase family protein n=1 Tax=Microbacterium TaxID=33882 RepID=UPI00254BE76B|nr:acyl-CoA dehydrogenase family protein [Microbacterium sp. zg-Y1090]MCR2819819.1 acyl-CoA dehydrogenase family protein [Microbacterium sp. zg.Y1090]WIM28624.1 acyl-CoA dehydrogenase family protein [Microbacterium sp. zg-Y1090]
MTSTTPALTDDEREAILEAVREYTAAELAPYALERDERGEFPRESLRRGGELGLGGICIREDVGGAGLRRADAAAIYEALAEGDPAIAAYVSIHNMVAGIIDAHGTPEQRAQWLPGLVSMTDFGSYCLTEPGVGSDAAALTTTAVRDGDDYVLTGVKQFISGAGEAGVYIVMARTGDAGDPAQAGARGVTAFLVPAGVPGLSFGAEEHKMGWRAQPTRQVVLDGVRVPASGRIGAEGEGFRIALGALDGGRLGIAACSLGGAQWALERTVAYVQQREAFGEQLAQKQSIVFTLADMATELHAARTLVRDAAAALDAGASDATARSAMAKRFATDAGFRVANDALQLHGGYGYLREYGIEKVVRDLRVHQILEGTNEIMRVIIGRELLRHRGMAR